MEYLNSQLAAPQLAKLREFMQEFVDQAQGHDAPQVHLSCPKVHILQGDRARPVATMGPVAEDFRDAVLGIDVADFRARIEALNVELGL